MSKKQKVSVVPVFGEINKPAPAPETSDEAERAPAVFTDVDQDAWYHSAVDWAIGKGVMNGVSDTQFAPGGTTTRAMVVTMLWRLEDQPDGKPSLFEDVPVGSWYEKAVNWAAEAGVVKGIPALAHEYVVNGRSPLEWMIDRYQVKTDKASGIVNDPNQYSEDPHYIPDLIRRLVTVSVETMEIVNSMVKINEIDCGEKMPEVWRTTEG